MLVDFLTRYIGPLDCIHLSVEWLLIFEDDTVQFCLKHVSFQDVVLTEPHAHRI